MKQAEELKNIFGNRLLLFELQKLLPFIGGRDGGDGLVVSLFTDVVGKANSKNTQHEFVCVRVFLCN